VKRQGITTQLGSVQEVTECCSEEAVVAFVLDCFLRAALCHLCVDVLDAQHALVRYQGLYPDFQHSQQYMLLEVGKLKYFAHKLTKTLSLFSIIYETIASKV
jgi:hypothetical protein